MVVLVLEVFQAIGQFSNVVVVKEGEGAQCLLVALFPLMLHQMLSNEVSYRLGSVHIPLPGDEPVELAQQMGADGDSESNQLFHGGPLSCS
jgi:hypothetical protein